MNANSIEIIKSYRQNRYLVWSYCAASMTFLLIAPILAFIFVGIALINGRSFPRPVRLILATVLAISMSMMNGARPISDADSNDIDGYYYVYQMLALGDLSYLTHFGGGLDLGGGLEIGVPLLMYLWGLFLPPLSVGGLMLCLSLASSFLLLIWIEKTFYSGLTIRSSAMVGICILFFNIYFSIQLTRQFFSLIILLYAFSAQQGYKSWAYVALAASFHLTAIPFYLMYRIMRKGVIGILFILFSLLIFRYFFSNILAAFDIFPASVSEKLVYFIDNDAEYTSSDIGSFRMILLLCCISLLVLIPKRFKPQVQAKPWLTVPWVAAIAHFTLLPIPLASLRTTLMVHSIAPGLIAYKMFEGGGIKVRNLRMLVMNFLLFYKISVYLVAEQSGNLFSTLYMLAVFFP